MTLYDLRQFIRLSGLDPIISSPRVDLIHTKLTKQYSSSFNRVNHCRIYE